MGSIIAGAVLLILGVVGLRYAIAAIVAGLTAIGIGIGIKKG